MCSLLSLIFLCLIRVIGTTTSDYGTKKFKFYLHFHPVETNKKKNNEDSSLQVFDLAKVKKPWDIYNSPGKFTEVFSSFVVRKSIFVKW